MLRYEDFQDIPSSLKFKSLLPTETPNLYTCSQSYHQYHLIPLKMQYYNAMVSLLKAKVFGNVIGFMKLKQKSLKKIVNPVSKLQQKECLFVCADGQNTNQQSLAAFIHRNKGQKSIVNQQFCSKLIEDMLRIQQEFINLNRPIYVLTPFHILMAPNLRFSLSLPFAHDIFEAGALPPYPDFYAPQLNLEHCESQAKAAMYSLGIVLLYVCGYSVTKQERSVKEWSKYLKCIRKEIKLFQGGKFTSKIIKLLLQPNQFIRDTPQTLIIKLNSQVWQSLRHIEPSVPRLNISPQQVSTIFTEQTEADKSRINRTIQIIGSGSHNGSNHNSMRTSEGKKSSDRDGYLKASPIQNLSKNTIPQIVQEHPKGIESPVQIKVDWDNSDSERSRQQSKYNISPEQMPSLDRQNVSLTEYHPRYNISLSLLGEDNNNKQKKSNHATLMQLSNVSQNKSQKSEEPSHQNSYQQDQPQIKIFLKEKQQHYGKGEETSDIKLFPSESSQIKLSPSKCHPKQQNKYQPNENAIIKYEDSFPFQNQPPNPKLIKRSSNDSVELKDMNLIKQEKESDDEDGEEEGIMRKSSSVDWSQTKAQFDRKSKAILVTLIVMTAIYLAIDYFLS